MAVIVSRHKSPLGLPGGITLNPGRKVKVERWEIIKDHAVVSAWLRAGVISVEEEGQPAMAASDPLDHDGDGRKGGSDKQEPTDRLATLRGEYQDVLGKRPFHGWSEDELEAKIAEAKAG